MLRDGFLRFCNDPEIACCKAERELAQLRMENASLREQITESQRAVEDWKTYEESGQCCDVCKYGKGGDCTYPEGGRCKFEWRGPQAGKGE